MAVNPSWQLILQKPTTFLAFGFGSGLSPIMPGTMGTLAAVPLYLGMTLLPLWAYCLVTIAAFFVGIYFCQKASDTLGVHDHGGIVWDEFVGFWITMVAMPVTWVSVLVGFVAFRFFDMVKPWPIRWADKKVHGGFGIMLDDVIAGAMAAAVMQGIYFYNSQWLVGNV